MPYFEPLLERHHLILCADVPLPDRVEPRIYLACNRIEFLLEQSREDATLRRFRKYWREYLIVLTTTHVGSFRDQALAALDGSRLYGPWWGPGLLPRPMVDSLLKVRQIIEHGDFEEVFS